MQIPSARVYFPEEDRQRIIQYVEDALKTGMLTLGKYGREFEERFARYVGVKHAIAVSSGTSALEIIVRALSLEGASVVVPTNTFLATATAVIHAGARVLFADCDDSLCLDPASVRRVIQPNTRAVIVVHIGGMVAPRIRELETLCKERGVYLIEDAAHAHGSTLDGRQAGSFGHAAAFSFYPTKVITSGEGGMIVTNDDSLQERARSFRDQGKASFQANFHTELGSNWRMSEPHAAIGLVHFQRLDQFIACRRRAAQIYDRGLSKLEWLVPLQVPPDNHSNYYKYVALLHSSLDRPKVKKAIKERFNISLSGEVYELPCHLQPIFQKLLNGRPGQFPVAEELCRRQVCLPVYSNMTDEEANYVVNSLKEFTP